MDTTRLRDSVAALLLLIIVLFACPSLLLAALARRWARSTWDSRDRWQGIIAFGVFDMVVYGLLCWKWNTLAFLLSGELLATISHEWHALVITTGELWVLNILLTPVLALLIEGYTRLPACKGGGQPGTRLAVPDEAGGALVLGEPLRGDLSAWIQQGWFTYPSLELARHLVLVGSSGSGKTETTLRIALGAADSYGWKVIYLDAKGDLPTAARFLTAMEQAGLKRIKMFPREPFCGWRATTAELHNRFMEILDYTEPFYEDVANAILDFALNAPAGPPKNSAEFLGRLELYILKKLYAGTPEGVQLKRFPYEHVQGVFLRYRSFFSIVGRLLDGVWGFEDIDAAYLLLDGLALKNQTASLGRFFVEAFAQWIAHRKESTGVLLIIDELSAIALRRSDVAGLFERIRSFGGHIVVTAQSRAGMGTPAEAERILNAARGLVVHHCDDPERLVARAGTQRVPEFSHQVGNGGATGYSTLRMREQFRVDPNEVRELNVGECFVVCGGRAQKVRVNGLQVSEQAMRETLNRLLQDGEDADATPPASREPSPGSAVTGRTASGHSQGRTSGAPAKVRCAASPQARAKAPEASAVHSRAESGLGKPTGQDVLSENTGSPAEAPVHDGGPLKSGRHAPRKPLALPPGDNDLFPELH